MPIPTRRRSDEERNALAMANDGFAWNRACARVPVHHPDFEDMLQASRLGILTAAETYDPAAGAFTTYAWRPVISNQRGVRRGLVAIPYRRLIKGERPPVVEPLLDEPATEPGDDGSGRELVALLLAELPARTREMVERFYGLNGRTPETPDRLAKAFGVHRSTLFGRVRDAVRRLQLIARDRGLDATEVA